MKMKRDLEKELNTINGANKTEGALDISIENIKNRVNNCIDSAYTEKESYIMKSKKKIALIAVAATLVMGITVLPQAELYLSGSAVHRQFLTINHFRAHSR